MKNFKELDKRHVSEVEASILERWQKDDILNKCIENRSIENNFVFYDGPATANPMPLIRYIKSIYSNFLLNQGITG